MGLGRLQALFFECLPGDPLISRDNLASLAVDNVCSAPMDPELGIVPTSMEAVVPGYLKAGR
jgi:NADH dehydrogenase